jgi:pre-rRNA-processing protein TSR4
MVKTVLSRDMDSSRENAYQNDVEEAEDGYNAEDKETVDSTEAPNSKVTVNSKEIDFSLAQLGFISNTPLSSTSFWTHKCGGLPCWLIPTATCDLSCPSCGTLMPFLLQVYAPDDNPNAFHRVVYLFACRNGKCYVNDTPLKTFRSQLASVNSIYDGDEIINPLPKSICYTNLANFCVVCGCYSTKQCAKCKTAKYCSKEHQELDWSSGGHKSLCTSIPGKLGYLFPEFEIDIGDEPAQNEPSSFKFKPATDHEYADIAESSQILDDEYIQFDTIISKAPSQILRYLRVEDECDAEPIWLNEDEKPGSIPPCKCGAARTPELQIMPQLLNYLGIDEREPETIEWGILTIFTCSEYCIYGNDTLFPEYLWKQNFKSKV